eukprot:9661493-Lingulodinium_polyedra.AAC.1
MSTLGCPTARCRRRCPSCWAYRWMAGPCRAAGPPRGPPAGSPAWAKAAPGGPREPCKARPVA